MNTDLRYSTVLRQIRENDPDKVLLFIKKFKSSFNEAIKNDVDDPEQTSLMESLVSVGFFNIDDSLYKKASSVINVGEPESAGKGIADIVSFLMKRISVENRRTAISKLKNKILDLDEVEMSQKDMPATAAYGQSITFIKTILNGHDAAYIRKVLENIVRFL